MTLYDKTIGFILHYLDQQALQEGARLPTEPELAAMTGVSIVTVRRALSELAQQGVVRREQGRGTFLARPRVSAETTRIGSLRNGLALDIQSRLTTQLLSISQRSATLDEGLRLKLNGGASIWDIRRLRLLSGKAVIQEISLIPALLAPDLSARLAGTDDWSLYEVLSRDYGLQEVKEEQRLTCRRPAPEEAKLLTLPKGEWVVEIAGVALTTGSLPIDAFRMVFDAKAFAFRMETVTPVEVVQPDRG